MKNLSQIEKNSVKNVEMHVSNMYKLLQILVL